MKKPFLFFLSVLLLIAFGCSKDEQFTPGDDTPYKKGVTTQTIKFMSGSGTMGFVDFYYPEEGITYGDYEIIGGGNATHLGKYSVLNTVTFDVTNSPVLVPVSDWLGFITAANGDQIFTKLINGPYLPEGADIPHYDYEVLGGTGRFAEVTGGLFIMYGITDSGAGTWELQGEGVINY